MKSWKERLAGQITLKVLAVAALFLISLFVFSYIADEAVLEKEDVFDAQVHSFFLAHTTPLLVEAMRSFTFLGSSYFLLPSYIILITIFLVRKNYRYAIDISVVAISSFLLMLLLKHLFQRKRPDMPIIKGITSYSFPSGHSLSSFIFCSILAYIFWNSKLKPLYKWAIIILLFLLALTIGISRIVLNVHFATDVIAGFCLGVMWVIVSFWILRSINRRRPV